MLQFGNTLGLELQAGRLVCHAFHPYALGIEFGRGQEEIVGERHIGLVGLMQLELEISEDRCEREV